MALLCRKMGCRADAIIDWHWDKLCILLIMFSLVYTEIMRDQYFGVRLGAWGDC
jgi:hypothetical protein